MLTLVLATLLQSAPFPAPQRVPVTDALKCDWGTVVSASPFIVQTPSGPVTYAVNADLQALGADGQTKGPVATLKPNAKVRVYYVLDNGARLTEVDLTE